MKGSSWWPAEKSFLTRNLYFFEGKITVTKQGSKESIGVGDGGVSQRKIEKYQI